MNNVLQSAGVKQIPDIVKDLDIQGTSDDV